MALTPAELNSLIDRRNPSGLDGAAANKRLVEILHALADASGGGLSQQINSDWESTAGVSEILNKPETGAFGISILSTQTKADFFSLAGLGTAAQQNIGFFATALQGALADTAVQPSDLNNYELSLGNPSVDGWILSSTSLGVRSWIPIPSAPVSSVFGRTGVITSQSGDYIFAQIGSKPTTLSGYGITDAQPLNAKLTAISLLANASGWLHNDGAGVFSYSTPDHNSLASLQGGNLTERYHLTLAQQIEATQYATNSLNGLLSATDRTAYSNHVASTSNPHSTSDANLLTSDIATNNASTSKHGFLPKLPGSASVYLNGQGNYASISAVVSAPPGFVQVSFSGQTSITVTHNFGYYPLVQVLDNAGSPLVTSPLNITHASVNAFTVTFTTAQSGTVIASVGSPKLPNITVVSSNYAVLITDDIILCTASDITITFPTAVGAQGRRIIVDNASSGNVFATSPQTIEDQVTQIIPSQSAMESYSTNAVWRII